jgi:hypothetical protein
MLSFMMRTFSALIIYFFCFACSNNKAEKPVTIPPPPPPKYFFYPKANVYFDTVNKDYLFLTTDGKSWQSVKQIPAAMHVLMDKNVLIDSPLQPVWKDNERHKLVYSALLYASPSDTQEKKPVPVIKEAPKEVKKEKKGLAKFFDKIFGRKKKKEGDN